MYIGLIIKLTIGKVGSKIKIIIKLTIGKVGSNGYWLQNENTNLEQCEKIKKIDIDTSKHPIL